MIPQTNASLISVTRGGFTEDYDTPAGSETTAWSGYMEAYVQRKIRSAFNDRGELNRVLDVKLIVSADLPVTLQAGDIVTYQAGNPDNPETFAGRIQNITNPAYMAQLPDYYQCFLEEINVPVGT